MRRLTFVLHLALMLAILPWGAYAPTRAQAFAQALAVVSEAPADHAAAAETAAARPRPCHGPALPGLPCGLFLPPADLAQAMPPAAAPKGTRAAGEARLAPDGRSPAPLRRPPRLA